MKTVYDKHGNETTVDEVDARELIATGEWFAEKPVAEPVPDHLIDPDPDPLTEPVPDHLIEPVPEPLVEPAPTPERKPSRGDHR